MRSAEEIKEAEMKYTLAVWLERKERDEMQIELHRMLLSDKPKDAELAAEAFESIHKLHDEHEGDPEFNINSEENDDLQKAFLTGMICGKLSALRWVIGSNWDVLIT